MSYGLYKILIVNNTTIANYHQEFHDELPRNLRNWFDSTQFQYKLYCGIFGPKDDKSPRIVYKCQSKLSRRTVKIYSLK